MKPTLHAFDGQPVEAPARTRECGCREMGGIAVIWCSLHLVLGQYDTLKSARAIIIRALVAVADRVAAGDTPADAVANVKTRWGL